MTTFLLGLFIGASFGWCLCAIMVIGSQAEDEEPSPYLLSGEELERAERAAREGWRR